MSSPSPELPQSIVYGDIRLDALGEPTLGRSAVGLLMKMQLVEKDELTTNFEDLEPYLEAVTVSTCVPEKLRRFWAYGVCRLLDNITSSEPIRRRCPFVFTEDEIMQVVPLELQYDHLLARKFAYRAQARCESNLDVYDLNPHQYARAVMQAREYLYKWTC